MTTMLMECAVCFQEKGPDLMLSNDTCHGCAERQRLCQKCINGTVAKLWIDGACPLCGDKSGESSSGVETEVKYNSSEPSIIGILSTLGWVLFAMTGLSGVFLISQDGGRILGVSLIIAGVFQLSIFLGFSAIIDQLYKINVNTSKPDKSDS